MTRRPKLMLAVTLAVILCIAAVAQAKMFRFEDSFEYSVKAGFALNVNNTSGSVSVSKHAGDKVLLRVIKDVDASSRDKAEEIEDRIEVIIEAGEDQIDIDTRLPNGGRGEGFWSSIFGISTGSGCDVNYEIEVPVSVDVRISTTSGDVNVDKIDGRVRVAATSSDIEIDGIHGDCDIENTSGDIRIRDMVGNIDIMSTSSNALFDNIQGEVHLQATSGDTEAHWVVGSISITKTSGNVRISKSSGDIDVNATSGDIDIDQREGGFTINTSSGNVAVTSELAQGSLYEIETTSGDIELRVPTEVKGDVRLKTASGNIDTNLELQVRSFDRHSLEGRIRGGGKEIRLSSASGDITLEEY